jgi:argininosuccinate lyase
MRRAQPVLAAHQLLAWCEKFARDRERLADCRRRTNVLPLGSGALAGTTLPIDREHVKDALGFAAVAANSLDGASDRDFVCELAFVIALTGVHCSQWAEEWVIYSTQEFAFLRLPEGFCTGSSIMPQKINPDVLELVRGKSARSIGNLQSLLVLLKGLPTAYNRDLQEDKEPLFDSVEQVSLVLRAVTGMIETAAWNVERMQAAADTQGSAAIDAAEMLVERGTPFRQAHALVGGLVADSIATGRSLESLVAEHPLLGADAVRLLQPGVAVSNRTTPGGAGPGVLAVQLSRLEKLLESEARVIDGLNS